MAKAVQLFLLVALLPLFTSLSEGGDELRGTAPDPGCLRRPIALALRDDGKTLLIANRDSGTLSVVDTAKLRVESEVQVGRKVSGMAMARGSVVVTDEGSGEIVLLDARHGHFRESRRIKVGLTPVGVQISEDGSHAFVACLWPRQLIFVDLTSPSGFPVTALDLPFAPRCLLLVPERFKLIVADAFGGNLAVVDVRQKKIDSRRKFPGHNIRGLALDRSAKHLLLTNQTLNARGHTVAGDIRAGNVIDNQVRKLSLADLLDPWADVTRNERVYPLGDVERGAGDPAEVAESYNGHVLVTLAGVNELAIGRPEEVIWSRLPVGHRPTALVVDRGRRRAYVANTFSDSVSVIDLQAHKVIAEVPLRSSPPKLTSEQRGETLFFDARLSLDGWYSCHSCHPDGHSNGRLNDNFTDGSFGTPKRALSLLGVKETGPWAWDGRMPDLESQVRNSLKSTLQGPQPRAEQVRDLTAYLRTLEAPPAVRKARGAMDSEILKRGRLVFTRQKCATCHTPPAFTSPKTYDVGVRDEAGGKNFNPPSLRGLSQAGPYFHDNRALTLGEVFTRHKHETGSLSTQELADLLYYLESL